MESKVKKDIPVIFTVKLSLNKLNELTRDRFPIFNEEDNLDLAQTKLADLIMDLGFNYVHVMDSKKEEK